MIRRSTRLTACLPAGLLAVSLAACAWPPERGGGMAEIHPPAFLYSSASFEAYRPYRTSLARFQRLRVAGADEHLPGHVVVAERQTYRIERQLAAGLTNDAQRDIVNLKITLDRIERLLSRVSSSQES